MYISSLDILQRLFFSLNFLKSLRLQARLSRDYLPLVLFFRPWCLQEREKKSSAVFATSSICV